MVKFPSEFSSKAGKYIKKLDIITKKRIEEKVDKLEEDPFPQEVERVEDFKGEKVFRVRVGDYRILYFVRYESNQISVANIDKRSRVYD